MVRLLTFLSWSSISLAMVLATVAVLAVPENAFAAGTCQSDCKKKWGTGNSSYWNCIADCCNSLDAGNLNCCADRCDSGDSACQANCQAGLFYYTSCAPPLTNNGCPFNNGNAAGCPGITCAISPSHSCLCVYDFGTTNCNCPP